MNLEKKSRGSKSTKPKIILKVALKIQDVQMTNQKAGREIAGRENQGVKLQNLNMYDR